LKRTLLVLLPLVIISACNGSSGTDQAGTKPADPGAVDQTTFNDQGSLLAGSDQNITTPAATVEVPDNGTLPDRKVSRSELVASITAQRDQKILDIEGYLNQIDALNNSNDLKQKQTSLASLQSQLVTATPEQAYFLNHQIAALKADIAASTAKRDGAVAARDQAVRDRDEANAKLAELDEKPCQ